MASEHSTTGEPTRSDRSAAAFAVVMAVLVVGAVVATLVARGRWWIPPLASVQGRDVDRLLFVTFGIISAAFILVQGVLALFVWLYRDRGQRASHWHEHRGLELTYTIVPAIVMAGLTFSAAGLWSRLHSAAPDGALVVEVRAEQFGWRARYPGPDGRFGKSDPAAFTRERVPPAEMTRRLQQNPFAIAPDDPVGRDDIVTGPLRPMPLHLVVNRPVEIRLWSKDVLHSFFVPGFRVKQDVVPGITVSIWFTPTVRGEYEIACAELCGLLHYSMLGEIVVETQEQFDAWLATAGAPGGPKVGPNPP
jgi:cytochrome c oxidase subunit 2